jgi:hypothetical protein
MTAREVRHVIRRMCEIRSTEIQHAVKSMTNVYNRAFATSRRRQENRSGGVRRLRGKRAATSGNRQEAPYLGGREPR